MFRRVPEAECAVPVPDPTRGWSRPLLLGSGVQSFPPDLPLTFWVVAGGVDAFGP